MASTAGYVSCNFVYFAGEDDSPLADEVISFHQEIEDAIAALGDADGVAVGMNHSDVHVREDGEYFADYVWLDVHDLRVIDDLASQVIESVRQVGIKFDHEFYVQKHLLHGPDSRSVFVRRIYPARNTKWRQLAPDEVKNL